MSINDFRAKSKEGGFDTEGMGDAEMLLNPESFKAVGKVERWGETMFPLYFKGKSLYWQGDNMHRYTPHLVGWHLQMRNMIDFIADGRSIDEFLETL